MVKRLQTILDHPAKWHIILVFVVIVLNKLGIDVRGGEEQYLAFAKQFTNPDWIPDSFTYTEFPGSRLVFQWIVGPVMQVMSFEAATVLFRSLSFALIAVPIGLILKRLNVTLLLSFVFIQMFVMSTQNLVGGEWIIRNFEPKAVAYAFVFFGIYALIQKRYLWIAIYLAIATYFHVLVGAWIILLIGLHLLIEKKVQDGVKMGLLYAVILAPFIWYLFTGYMVDVPASKYDLDNIYCYYRLPNHLGIWKTTEYFMKSNFYDMLILIGIVFSAFWWFKKLDERYRPLARIMLMAFAINLIYIGVAAMDHFAFENSGGFGLKYYPFRTNSIGMFVLFILLAGLLLKHVLARYPHPRIKQGLFVLSLILLISQLVNNVNRSQNHMDLNPDFSKLVTYIKAETPQDACFLILQPTSHKKEYISFGRMAERENFIVPKFVSAERGKLSEWYRRERIQRALSSKPEGVVAYSKRENFTYLVTDNVRADLTLIHHTESYYLYAL
jgi:hypothetical protein